jgi:hypothetical protein
MKCANKSPSARRPRRAALRLWCWASNSVQAYATEFCRSCPVACDRPLGESEEPPPGAHLVTPRIGFVHHGIYVGNGNVVHCGAVSRFLPRGPVEEVSLRYFRRGRPVAVRGGLPAKFRAEEVVYRARSRLDEDRYRLLTNNCEHFCEWCLRDRQRSYQVERLARWVRPLKLIFAANPAAIG